VIQEATFGGNHCMVSQMFVPDRKSTLFMAENEYKISASKIPHYIYNCPQLFGME